jgi:hypothetical protein
MPTAAMREWRLSVRDRLINSPPGRVTGGVVVEIGQHPVAKAQQRHWALLQASRASGTPPTVLQPSDKGAGEQVNVANARSQTRRCDGGRPAEVVEHGHVNSKQRRYGNLRNPLSSWSSVGIADTLHCATRF